MSFSKATPETQINKTFEKLKKYNVSNSTQLDDLTFLLKNLCASQEATVRIGHRTTDWFQIGKGVRQGCILSPCLFNLYAEYIWKRQWQPTPVLLPGKSRGQRSLVGCSPWGCYELDMTEQLHFSLSSIGEGNGNPVQCSCLENPRDGGI